MNLFELNEEKNDTIADIKYYTKERKRLESKVGLKASVIDDMKVSGCSSSNTKQAALNEYTQTGIYLDEAINKLKNLNSLTKEKYNNYKRHNDYDKKIYVEKKLFHWSNAKISARHGGISRWSIKRIIDKIESKK